MEDVKTMTKDTCFFMFVYILPFLLFSCNFLFSFILFLGKRILVYPIFYPNYFNKLQKLYS